MVEIKGVVWSWSQLSARKWYFLNTKQKPGTVLGTLSILADFIFTTSYKAESTFFIG